MSIQETLQLFDALRSEDESIRNAAHQTLSQLLEDHQFFLILFQILSSKELNETYYMLGSSCLLAWYRRNTFSKEEENIILRNLQPLLLIYHPSHKNLFKFYHLFQVCYHNEEVISFLANSIELISLETPPNILVCALKLAWITIKQYNSTIHSSIRPIILEITQKICYALQPILNQTGEILERPLGATIIRYALKIIDYSKSNLILNDEMISLIFNTFEIILNSMQNIENREFYLLVRYCSRILRHFRNLQNEISDKNLFMQMIITFTLRFVAALAPLHLDCICSYLLLLSNYTNFISETPEILPMLLCISELTENDLSDFEVNPEVFYEYAYASKQNSRGICYQIIGYSEQLSNQFIQTAISEPPTETILYLFSSCIRKAIASELEQVVVEYIMNLYTSEFIQSSPLNFSTFLYLVYKSVSILPHEFLTEIFQLAFLVIICSSSMDTSGIEIPPLVQQASQSLVIVINAVRVCNRIIKNEIIVPTPQIVGAVIELLPKCSTHYASKLLHNILEHAKSDENIRVLFLSEQEAIKMAICENIQSSLSFALASTSSNEEYESSISFYLGLLTNILEIEPEPIITEQICAAIELLLTNFDDDFGKNLASLLVLIASTGFELYPQILSILIESMLNVPYMINHLDYMNMPIYAYMIKNPESFVELGMAPNVCLVGLKAFQEFHKNPALLELTYSQESRSAGVDLFFYAMQIDNSFDISPIWQFIEENEVNDYDFILIKMSIIITRPASIENPEILLELIVSWVQENNAKYIYEKRLAILSLFVLCQSDEIMSLAIQLLEQEKEQTEQENSHSTPIILNINVMDYAKQAALRCSQANQAMFLEQISKMFE